MCLSFFALILPGTTYAGRPSTHADSIESWPTWKLVLVIGLSVVGGLFVITGTATLIIFSIRHCQERKASEEVGLRFLKYIIIFVDMVLWSISSCILEVEQPFCSALIELKMALLQDYSNTMPIAPCCTINSPLLQGAPSVQLQSLPRGRCDEIPKAVRNTLIVS